MKILREYRIYGKPLGDKQQRQRQQHEKVTFRLSHIHHVRMRQTQLPPRSAAVAINFQM